MPRFDNFTNQLDKLPRPTSAAAYIDARSDAIFMVSANGRQVTAAMSQDMSAFMEFMALGSPNTNMTVSTTTSKANTTYQPNKFVYKTGVTVTSAQVGGANPAAFDLMRSDTRFTQSASMITGLTRVSDALSLSIGSKIAVSSVEVAYEVEGTQTLLKNYYATSGTGAIVGGNTTLMTALVK